MVGGEGLEPAAFIGAPVVLEVEFGAFVDVPVAEAVILLLASNRSVVVIIVSPGIPVRVNLAFLPR